MQRLRHARFLARLVLAWFALAIGVAVASPVVQPKSLQLLCSGGVMKLLAQGDAGEPAPAAALDCPLCATTAGPPPQQAHLGVLAPLAAAVPPLPAGWVATRSAASPPARGPPAASLV